MNILEAMNDPALFGKFFRRGMLGRDSWKPWRAFLCAVFGLPIDEELRALYEKHTKRRDAVVGRQFREAYAVCGRRSGKSSIAALIALYLALFVDHGEVLAPGEEGVVLLVAPDRKQCQQILNFVKGMLRESKTLRSMVAENGELTESVTFKNRVVIQTGTANLRLVRGFTVIAAIVDECAFLRSEEGAANPDTEIFGALRPAMLTVPDALLLGISSPYAKRGLLWEEYKSHFGQEGSDTLVWQGETRAMNSRASLIEIGKAYLKDRAAAEAEYGAQFRSDLESFLGETPVQNCVMPGRFELPFRSGQRYLAFCDPSGGRSDSMTLAVAHLEGDKGILDLVREVRPPFSPEGVVEEFVADLKRYHVHEVTGDYFAAEWVSEQFEKRGVTYKASDQTKSEIFLELSPAVLSKQVELLDHAGLIRQLSSLERRTGRGGRDTIDHEPNAHDDLANSAAGALVAVLKNVSGKLGLIEFYASGAATQFLSKAPAPVIASSKPAPENLPSCPKCRVKLQRFGSTAAMGDLRCGQCGRVFFSDGTPVAEPQSACSCTIPLIVVIAGGARRCQQCGWQSNEPQAFGPSRAWYQNQRGYRRFG